MKVNKILKNGIFYAKKHPIFLILVLLGGFLIFGFLLPRVRSLVASPLEKYETVKVLKSDITQSISASGEIKAEKQVTLNFQNSGQLAWVGVSEGNRVKKWQAIASLDKREVEKNLKKRLLDYMNERWDFEQIHDDYNIEGRPLEKVILTDAEKRILEKAQFDLDNAVLDVEIRDLAIKLATLITPIEGIVTNIDTPISGVNITPVQEFVIADPARMRFVANVDEADISLVQLGQKVIISLDAFPEEKFEGRLERIAFASKTTSGGGTAFEIEVSLPENKDEKFKIGMNGDAEIIIEERQSVLTLPLEAIKIQDSQTFVQALENRKIRLVPVQKGLESETDVEIESGVSEGQIVILGEKQRK